MQGDVVALLAALPTLEAKLPDGEGCNVQGGVAALTAGAPILLNGVPAEIHMLLTLVPGWSVRSVRFSCMKMTPFLILLTCTETCVIVPWAGSGYRGSHFHASRRKPFLH